MRRALGAGEKPPRGISMSGEGPGFPAPPCSRQGRVGRHQRHLPVSWPAHASLSPGEGSALCSLLSLLLVGLLCSSLLDLGREAPGALPTSRQDRPVFRAPSRPVLHPSLPPRLAAQASCLLYWGSLSQSLLPMAARKLLCKMQI